MAATMEKPSARGQPNISTPNAFGAISKAVCLLALAAVYSPISQLKLAPVYGSIPSAQFHHLGTALLTLLALTRPALFLRWVPNRIPTYLQVLACWIPIIQSFLFRYSGQLGPTLGPLVTEGLTYYPLVFLTAYSTSAILRSAQINRYVHKAFGDTVLGLAGYGIFTVLESSAWRFLLWTSTLSVHLTRTAIQVAVGSAYVVLSSPKMHLATILPLLQVILFDPRSTTPIATDLLHSSLQSQNWTLLDRGDSVTGYVSVLEDMNMQYRLLRCDHSLLGGEWLVNDERRRNGIVVPEPIYAVFEKLEAVRLVRVPDDTRNDEEKNALVIGLGIGTAPKALIAHGINTTVVELDPLVHEYATKYFDLPSNHIAVLQDAVSWTKDAVLREETYDFIIHDVFTGGAEPLPLFTTSFLETLNSLLAANGVVALNYAGDLGSPSTKMVLNTINTAFNHQCRMFRDQPAQEGDQDSDFLNMVIFCTKTEGLRIDFRNPVEADFLNSKSRRYYLLPRPELELAFPSEEEMQAEKVQLLTTQNMKEHEKMQFESAKRHWTIMRKVLPAFVWENW